MKEESGKDVDPSGMRFWTNESQQIYKQLHLQTGDQHLFRKLNPEPLWVTRNRKGDPHNGMTTDIVTCRVICKM